MRLKIQDIAMISLFVALTSVGSKIQIPGPIVPFTAQFFFVTMGGVLMGAKRGMIAQLVYILLGLAGVPVFAAGAGISYIFKPTFGYLIGFTVSAFLAGFFCDRLMKKQGKIKFWQLLLVSFLCLLIVYICGVLYYLAMKGLYLNEAVQIETVLINFVALFLLTDTMWCLLIAFIGPRIRKAVQNYVL